MLTDRGDILRNIIYVRDFGAIPNDHIDDSEFIQRAINNAINSQTSSIVSFEPGIYLINKGIIIADQQDNGEYFFVGIHLSGHIPTFDGDQRIGATTVFRSKSQGFTIGIQSARNCRIENIVFEGSGLVYSTSESILNDHVSNWSLSGLNRTNQYSPHCAIVIDPFYFDTETEDRYPHFEKSYSNISNGGSSMLTISGCSFTKYYIAIANNPSTGVSNGDNINVKNCYVSHCHTFWSSGQTQSRNNHIQDIYALFIHTLVSGVEIGRQNGTPPFVSSVNLAGFCKYVFNINTRFSSLWVSQCYFESIWSLGIVLTNSVSFNQCQIQFKTPDSEIYAPPFHLFNRSVVHFRDCGLEYFSSCQTTAPIMLISGALQLSGGWIEGGVITSNGFSNEGGEEIHNVSYENVFIKCQNRIAGKNQYSRPIINLSHELFLEGEQLKSNDNSVFSRIGNTYNIFSIGEVNLEINDKTKLGVFTIKHAGLLKEGDNLFTDQIISLSEFELSGYFIKPAIGYVKKIDGNKIIVEGIPLGLKEGKMILYIVEFPVFVPPIWGDIQVNSSTISNVLSYSPSFYPRKGDRLYVSEFAFGSYVIESNVQNKTIVMSTAAVSTKKGLLLKNADYKQELLLDEWNPELIPVIIEGADINLKTPFDSSYHFKSTSKSILNSAYRPTMKAID